MVVEEAGMEELRRLAPDLAPSISKLTVPAYVLDRSGTVRWINAAAIAHFGDLRGKGIGQIVDREFATPLTPRQMTVLRHLAAGKSTAYIAELLGISTETVRNHVRGITSRLKVLSRLEAVIRAHELGLV